MKPFLKILPMAFSFFAYSAHWWTDTEGSLAAAVEEMRPGYTVHIRRNNNASSFPAYSVQFGKCLQRLIKKMNDIGRDDLVERLVGIVKVENVGRRERCAG